MISISNIYLQVIKVFEIIKEKCYKRQSNTNSHQSICIYDFILEYQFPSINMHLWFYTWIGTFVEKNAHIGNYLLLFFFYEDSDLNIKNIKVYIIDGNWYYNISQMKYYNKQGASTK